MSETLKVQHRLVCGTFDAIVEVTAFLGYLKNTMPIYERRYLSNTYIRFSGSQI